MRTKRPHWLVVSTVVSLVMAVGVSLFTARNRSPAPAPAVAPPPPEPPDSRPHWADRAALIVALLSTVVSVIALIVSVEFAQHPYPADPTQLPSFGTQQERRNITSVAESYELFDFLRDNAGRKVRLNVGFYKDGPFEVTEPDGVTVAGPDCPGPRDLTCGGINLKINEVSEQRPGLGYAHGEYILSGYFADLGSLGVWTGIEVVAITPLTAVEAVS